jgi:hypothetical protein
MYVLLVAYRMLSILSDRLARPCVAASTFTIAFDSELSPGEGQIGQGCGAVAAAYPDLKECEALAQLGLRYTDTVRARLYLCQ